MGLKALTCTACRTEFGVSDAYFAARLEDGHAFFCPQGCRQYIPSLRAEVEKLRDALDRAERNGKWDSERAKRLYDETQRLHRSIRAYKANLTRLRRAKGKAR